MRTDGSTVTTGAPRARGEQLDYPLPAPIDGSSVGGQACLLVDGTRSAQVLGEAGNPSISLRGAERGSWLEAIPLLSGRVAFGRGTVLGRAALPLAILAILLAGGIFVGLGARHFGGAPIGRRSLVLLGVAGSLWGVAYAVTTPPFQVPDENAHARYAEFIHDQRAVARTSDPTAGKLSDQLYAALVASRASVVQFASDRRPPWTQAEDAALDAQLASLPSGDSTDAFDQASSQPPTYYAIVAAAQTVVGGSSLDRLLVGRLVSALLFGFAIAGAAAFAREAVPRAGGLVVAGAALFASLPITGFIAGGVNPDALLAAVAAWALALTARILRRGPTLRRCVGLGLLVGLGVMAKLTFVGLVPLFLAAAVVLLVRGLRAHTLRRDVPLLAAAVAAACVVAAPYFAWAILSGRGIVFGPPSTAPAFTVSLRQNVTYAIGLFVGEIGPIERLIPNSGPIDVWGDGLVGRLGWLDYGFPRPAVLTIISLWGVLAVGAVIGLVRSARARRGVPVDALVYGVGLVALALVIARAGLVSRLTGAGGFEQARYLFPVAAIGVGGVALALRQLPGARWREWAASAVLVGALAHGVAGYLITVGRYFA